MNGGTVPVIDRDMESRGGESESMDFHYPT